MPSAVLALLLGAFFLSEDGKPLRAVYGDADLSGHREWVEHPEGRRRRRPARQDPHAGRRTSPPSPARGWPAAPGGIAAATSPWVLVAAGARRGLVVPEPPRQHQAASSPPSPSPF